MTRQQAAPLIRSPLFVFRLVLGLLLAAFGVLCLLVFEKALIGLRNDLATLQGSYPDWLPSVIETVIASIVLGTFLIALGALLWRRHFRRVLLLLASVLLAGSLSALVAWLVLRLATSDELATVIRSAGPNSALGNKALTAIVAVLTISGPWIGRRIRPWVLGIAAGGLSISFLGQAAPVMSLPMDIGLGMVAGSLVALVFRTRDRTPSEEELADTLRAAGIDVVEVRKASVDARGSVPWFVGTGDGSRLFVKTLGTDQRAADLMFRAYRWIRLRHAGDRRPFASLERAVEHEALLSLAAHAEGVRTPRLDVAAEIGTDGMLLAYERIDGRSLDDVAPEQVTDDLLREVWRLVDQLQTGRIAHRDLRLANVFIEASGTPWLIDFGFAELAAPPELLARDVAELLGSTSVTVGPDRAVAAAIAVLGRERVEAALPWIQPLALSTATRSQLAHNKGFEKLRAAASKALDIDEVSYEKIERFSAKTAITIATLALTAYILIPQFAQASGFLQELTHADLMWALAAMAASILTYVAATVGLIGAIPMRLAFGPVFGAQLASSFANRITPAKVGGMATNVRFLQKRSIPPATAISAVGLNTLAGFIVHVTLLIGIGVVAGASSQVSLPIPSGTTALVVVGGLILLSGVLMALPIGRKLVTKNLLPALRTAASSVAAVAKSPAKIVALFAGSAMVTVMYAASMVASLAAFGSTLGVVSAVFVYLAGAAVATAAPTPGGVGATEAALVAGYTAVGVDPTVAFAAVLLFRFVTFWLPILPGYVALGILRRRGDL
jgi:uncharacterized protein (TIRG00374 family)